MADQKEHYQVELQVEPKHKMYLNSYSEDEWISYYEVEPKHKMYLNSNIVKTLFPV